MKSKRVTAILGCLCALTLFLVPTQEALGQCGGYCQSSGSCPATGYGCGAGLCCYCCETCSSTVCAIEHVGWTTSNPPQQIVRNWFYQNLYYNCYTGSNCSFSHTSNDQQCNGNCRGPNYTI
jgi:hypothetical protein